MNEPFSSFEKAGVRERCLRLIEELRVKTTRQLAYFGLPSPWMGDVRVWKAHLGRIIAVEMEARFVPDLLDRAYTLGLLYQLSYFVGDVDTILQAGVDRFGRDVHATFPIELVNLDYCSGLVYEGFARIAAIESLFRVQARRLVEAAPKRFPYFLLFITHRCHATAGKQKTSRDYVTYLTRDASLYRSPLREYMEAMREWYSSDLCPLEYRHKAFVVGKVLEFAQAQGFRIVVRDVIGYKGDADTPMLHYEFEAYPVTLGHPIPTNSGLGIADILNFPVVTIAGDDLAGPDRPGCPSELLTERGGA